MFSLKLASYLIVAPTVMGIFIVVILTMGMGSAVNISIAAIAGAIAGIPAALIVAKQIDQAIRPRNR